MVFVLLFCGGVVALLAEGVDRNTFCSQNRTAEDGSPSSRRAWIEISKKSKFKERTESPSSRRAWIEIALTAAGAKNNKVALLAEGVDRNNAAAFGKYVDRVALLAEGVDRNPFRP